MTPEERARVAELFDAVLDHPEAERAEFLAAACAGNELIRAEVLRLLQAEQDRPHKFLNSSSGPAFPTAALEAAFSPVDGSIGPYRLLQRIGSGGMGEVWLADQTEPVHRRVALKLIKAGMDTGDAVTRFQAERQALALMDHPSIAKVFDAGSTSQGRLYFAMEYITGVPITKYCDLHKMTVPERLELFVQVCEGVQHAHQKAIIHRDLKPSNILVSEVDGKPVPRIIDFGIAKAISQALDREGELTRTGAMLGTPSYMSPEQAGSGGADVDTRTDVYSLGAVLYELLVGVRPLELHNLPPDEIRQRLEKMDTPKPSARLRAPDENSSKTAQDRGCDPPASATLSHQLRGDLDAITLKALEKDRSRRYGSPSDLAADIQRYLRNEPVLAVAPSIAYRARKFVRRYRGALLTAFGFAVVLMVAAVVSVRQSIRANREAATTRAVDDFLQHDLLSQASLATQAGSKAKPDPHLEVRTALDRAAERIEGKFAGQPEVEASIRDTMGQTYLDLGLYPEARKQLEQALDLHRRTLGAKNPRTLETMSLLGRVAEFQGKYPEAEGLLTQALAAQRRVLGPEHPDTLSSTTTLANVYSDEGRYPQAEVLLSETLDVQRRMLGPENADTLHSMNNLANVYYYEGKYAQTEALYSQVLEIRRRKLGPDHPDTLASMDNLAVAYWVGGEYAKAEAVGSQLVEIRRSMQGVENPDTLRSMNNLANVYDAEGKYPQAEALYSRVLEIRRSVLSPEHPETIRSMNNLANAYNNVGKYSQAEALASQTLEISRRVLGPERLDTLASMDNLADSYGPQGKYTQAEALFLQMQAIAGRVLSTENPLTLSFLSDFARMYQRQGKYALAESYAAQVLTGRRHALGPGNPDTMASEADLALAYVSQGNFAAAEPLARQTLDFYQKNDPGNWQRFRAETLLGACRAGEKKHTEAESLLREGYEGMLARKDRIAAPDRYYLDRARDWLARVNRSQNHSGNTSAENRSETP